MSNRFLSNIVVLALFGIGFAAITLSINWLASTEAVEQHEFSSARRLADQYFEARNFEAAARHYKQLSETDPENGGAKISYAVCVSRLVRPYVADIQRELNLQSPDMETVDAIREDGKESVLVAIEAFKDSLEFPQFRNHARFNLALLYAFLKDSENATNYLKAALRDKYKYNYKLRSYTEFRLLADDADFQALLSRS